MKLMRKIHYLLLFLFLFSFSLSFAENRNSSVLINTIDQNDSIIFDIENASYANGKMLIPILIHSDDSIFALDFSLRFNDLRLQYDTIYDPSGTIQPFVYYNPSDSTLRLTSSSFSPYPQQTPVFILVFDVLSLPVLPADIFQILGYLNGDPCTVDKAAILFTAIQERNMLSCTVFPNPAQRFINISSNENTCLSVFNIQMQEVKLPVQLSSGNNVVSLEGFVPGIYYFRLSTADKVKLIKVLITD